MRRIGSTLCTFIALTACSGKIDSADDDDTTDPPPVVCEQPRMYMGFGGALGDDRPQIVAGSDRRRVKPYGALATEVERALGAGADTAVYAGTFGKPPARWYEEPAASAATVYASFAIAYDGCTRKTMAGGDFDLEPTAERADVVCRALARDAWQREATDDEASICATYAVSQTTASDPPRTRWAYTCATVLASADFLTF